MGIKSETKLSNGLTRYLFEDGSYIDKEAIDLSNLPSESEKKQILARSWRDQELRESDWIVPTTDHPQHSAYITYRKALRDWPSTSDFPDTKPTLG
jgi:hypothetical protein